MSYSAEISSVLPAPVTALQYRDISSHRSRDTMPPVDLVSVPTEEANQREEATISESQLAARIEKERADAAREAEQKLRREYDQKLLATRAPVARLIAEFESERSHYYARVETETVQLALAIAAKILHREARVDPMLVAALVRLALEKMRDGSTVTLRVSPGLGESWRQYFAAGTCAVRVEVTEDQQLSGGDCLLETELGSANFGIEAQLKEVEQGFFDLLALRPTNK